MFRALLSYSSKSSVLDVPQRTFLRFLLVEVRYLAEYYCREILQSF